MVIECYLTVRPGYTTNMTDIYIYIMTSAFRPVQQRLVTMMLFDVEFSMRRIGSRFFLPRVVISLLFPGLGEFHQSFGHSQGGSEVFFSFLS